MKILLFIVLKVIEISGSIFIPYFLGRLIVVYAFKDKATIIPAGVKCLTWIVGIFTLLGLIWLILMFYWLVPIIFEANWNLVNQIIK